MARHNRFTPLIIGLLLLNLAGWLYANFAAQGQFLPLKAGFISLRISDPTIALTAEQANLVGWMLPKWLTPLSSAFVHVDWMHLLFNMLILVFLGALVERALGSWRFVTLYLIGAYAAATVHFLADPEKLVPMVGASGAISALMAVYFLLFARKRPAAIGPIPQLYVHMGQLLLFWGLVNALMHFAFNDGMGGGIAVWAHMGGFVAGLLLVVPLARAAARRDVRNLDRAL